MRKIMLVIDDYQELITLDNLLRRLGFDVMSLGKEILVPDALTKFNPEIVIASAKGRFVDGLKVATRAKKHTPSPRVAITYAPSNPPSLNAEAQLVIDALITVPIQPHGLIKVVSQLANLDPGPLLGKYQKLTSKTLESTEKESSFVQGPSPSADESRFVQSAYSDKTTEKITVTSANTKPAHFDDSARPDGRVFPPPSAYRPTEKPGAERTPEAKPAPVRLAQSTDGDPWANQPEEWDPIKTAKKAATLRTQRSDKYDRFLGGLDDGPVTGVLPKEKAAQAMRQLRDDSQKEKDELDRIDREKREFVRAMFVDEKKDSDEGE